VIVLDTNVISEFLKPATDPTVEAWANNVSRDSMFLSAMVLGELLAGANGLEDGRRKVHLLNLISDLETQSFLGRILPFDASCASRFGVAVAKRARAGRPIGTADAAIAATALTFGMRLATRNTRDFEGLGLDLINPFGEDV
jgi:toxin FitB